MSNVVYVATNHPSAASPIEFDITPIANFWLSEVLVVLNTALPPTGVQGKIHPGTAAHPSHLTINVGQTVFNGVSSNLGGATVEVSIDYDDATLNVTNVTAISIGLRATG